MKQFSQCCSTRPNIIHQKLKRENGRFEKYREMIKVEDLDVHQVVIGKWSSRKLNTQQAFIFVSDPTMPDNLLKLCLPKLPYRIERLRHIDDYRIVLQLPPDSPIQKLVHIIDSQSTMWRNDYQLRLDWGRRTQFFKYLPSDTAEHDSPKFHKCGWGEIGTTGECKCIISGYLLKSKGKCVLKWEIIQMCVMVGLP